MRKSIAFILIILAVLFSSAFDTLTVMTYDSYSVSEELVEEFEKANDIEVQFITAGNGGEMLSRAILTKDSPIADVIIGFDDSQLKKVFDSDILEPYEPAAIGLVPENLQADGTGRAIPFDFGDICINYDTAYFRENALDIPVSLSELADPQYRGLLVTENPASSNTGIGFLLATIAEFGEDGYIGYWNDLIRNGLEITSDWTTAYYTNFSASSGMGPQPMVVSYTSSPAAEVIYAETELEDAPTASLDSKNMCYRLVEYCGILKNTEHLESAKLFIDALLSPEWQEDLPLQMFVYPVNSEAVLPEEFQLYGQPAAEPAFIDPASVMENREKWISEWTDQVLSQY